MPENEETPEQVKLAAYHDVLIDLGISEQTLAIVTRINGNNLNTMSDILFAHTGYRSLGQFAMDVM